MTEHGAAAETIEATLNEEDFLSFNRYTATSAAVNGKTYKKNLISLFLITSSIFFSALILQMYGTELLTTKAFLSAALLVPVALLFGLLMLPVMWWTDRSVMRRRSRALFRSSGSSFIREPFALTISSAGVSRTSASSTSETLWHGILSIEMFDRGIALYTSSMGGYFAPLSAFRDKAHMASFASRAMALKNAAGVDTVEGN